jgi:hypothetical protein
MQKLQNTTFTMWGLRQAQGKDVRDHHRSYLEKQLSGFHNINNKPAQDIGSLFIRVSATIDQHHQKSASRKRRFDLSKVRAALSRLLDVY